MNGSGSPHSGHEVLFAAIWFEQIWHLAQGAFPHFGQRSARFEMCAGHDGHSMSFDELDMLTSGFAARCCGARVRGFGTLAAADSAAADRGWGAALLAPRFLRLSFLLRLFSDCVSVCLADFGRSSRAEVSRATPAPSGSAPVNA